VGGVEDFLAAEIPEVNLDVAGFSVGERAGLLPRLDIDAAGGVFGSGFDFERVIFEFFHDGGFAHVAAAHQEEFGFQEEHGGFFYFVEEKGDSQENQTRNAEC